VVLNISTQIAPTLMLPNNYHFALMDISENDWINLVINKIFKTQ
jgi:hypothetical protein